MTQRTRAAIAAAAFLATILAANYATTRYGMVPVGFGLVATAGTYFAGLSFVLRDTLHDLVGVRLTLLVIAAGALLSFLIADPFIAAASAAAFAVAETADLAVYAPLRRRGYVRAAVSSNAVGAVVDSVVFLGIAGFPIVSSMPGQLVGKLAVTAAAVLVVVIVRAVSRESMQPRRGARDA